MTATTLETIDQLVAYLSGHPATERLASEIDQVQCIRSRSDLRCNASPARPRSLSESSGPRR